MKHPGLIRCIAVLAAALAYSLLFPQTLFRDCIHVVFGQEETENTGENTLTEEDYLDLFRLEKSDYKVTWKFFQKD